MATSAYDSPQAAERWAGGLSAFERSLLGTLPAGTGILDLGAASGRAAAFLRERGCRVLTADLAHAMASAGGGIQARAEELPFRNRSFDAVLMLRLLHLMPSEARRKAHAEVLRVLKPGGLMIVTVLCPPAVPPLGGAYAPRPVRRALKAAAYAAVTASNLLTDAVRRLPGGPGRLGPRDMENLGGERAFFHHFTPGGISDELLMAGWGAMTVKIDPALPQGWRRRLPFPGLEARSLGVLARAPL